MAKYESNIKFVNAPAESVYERLSDLSVLQEKLDSLPEEKRQEIQQKVSESSKGMLSLDSLHFTKETASLNAMGMTLTVSIVEKQPFKLVKYATSNSPIDMKLWVQMLPKDPNISKIRVTLEADIPFFLKPMVGDKIEGLAEKIADALTRIPY